MAGRLAREPEVGELVLELDAREHELLLGVDDLDRGFLDAVADLGETDAQDLHQLTAGADGA